MLTGVAVANYRSLHDIRLELGRLTVVTGPNGSGKSSLYRALRLLADCARGEVVGSLAREGGLPSALWAGPEKIGAGVRSGEFAVQGTTRKGPVSLLLGFASAAGFGYLADLGLPRPAESAFGLDPEVKREVVWSGPVMRPASTLVQRKGPLVQARGERGGWQTVTKDLPSWDSALAQLGDPDRLPELLAVREQVRGWRFYDGFRVDAHSPARLTQIGTRTFVLADDGRDLAAALQTIAEVGARGYDAAVADAFPGSRVQIAVESGRFDLLLHQHGLLRPLRTAELSDGTLRYLLWVAALLSPRPGELMVLNEPETSLHPDLVPALGRLIADAATRTQVVVVTHDPGLVAQLTGVEGAVSVELQKELGETTVVGAGRFDGPPWSWGTR